MEFFGLAITVLAAILTYQTWKNGKWMKQAHEDTQSLIKNTQNLIRSTHEDTMSLIKEMRKEMLKVSNISSTNPTQSLL